MARGRSKHTLYFMIRSFVVGNINAAMLLGVVYILGSINVVQTFFLGIILFTISLVISRLFETQIEFATKKILRYLDKNKKVKNFILKYF